MISAESSDQASATPVIVPMASTTELPVDQFLSRYWRHRHAFHSGLTGRDYWSLVLERNEDYDASLVSELIEMDALSWSDYREAVWGHRGGVSRTG